MTNHAMHTANKKRENNMVDMNKIEQTKAILTDSWYHWQFIIFVVDFLSRYRNPPNSDLYCILLISMGFSLCVFGNDIIFILFSSVRFYVKIKSIMVRLSLYNWRMFPFNEKFKKKKTGKISQLKIVSLL